MICICMMYREEISRLNLNMSNLRLLTPKQTLQANVAKNKIVMKVCHPVEKKSEGEVPVIS